MGLVEGPLEARPWFKRWVGLVDVVVSGGTRVVAVLFTVEVVVVAVAVVVMEIGLGGTALDEG